MSASHCGFVAIIGRPNVGKSTLMNHLLGEKISITSRKPQTTRHRILGIQTLAATQIIYIDTPGIHQREKQAINRYMNQAAKSALFDVNAILFLCEVGRWTEEDSAVIRQLQHCDAPIIAVINKVDTLKDKAALLPELEALSQQYNFHSIVPLSALKGEGVDALQVQVAPLIPEGPHYFPEDEVTDKSLKFLCAEFVREKLFRLTGDELPYGATVEIELFKTDEKGIRHISALILVDKASHKQMVIGKQGEKLKAIGTAARKSMEALLEEKVFLKLWVKVKSGWADDERALQSLGYNND